MGKTMDQEEFEHGEWEWSKKKQESVGHGQKKEVERRQEEADSVISEITYMADAHFISLSNNVTCHPVVSGGLLVSK